MLFLSSKTSKFFQPALQLTKLFYHTAKETTKHIPSITIQVIENTGSLVRTTAKIVEFPERIMSPLGMAPKISVEISKLMSELFPDKSITTVELSGRDATNDLFNQYPSE